MRPWSARGDAACPSAIPSTGYIRYTRDQNHFPELPVVSAAVRRPDLGSQLAGHGAVYHVSHVAPRSPGPSSHGRNHRGDWMTVHHARIIALATVLVCTCALGPSTRLHAQQLPAELAIDELRGLAEQGDAEAQDLLGFRYSIRHPATSCAMAGEEAEKWESAPSAT